MNIKMDMSNAHRYSTDFRLSNNVKKISLFFFLKIYNLLLRFSAGYQTQTMNFFELNTFSIEKTVISFTFLLK